MLLNAKVAIVTGAASGFGAEIARVYAREGAKVVLVDLNEAGANAVAKEIGDNAIAVKCDVSRREDIDKTVKQAISSFGTVDIVVNNAGYTHKNQPLLDVDEATFNRVFDVNVKAIYHMIMAVTPLMRERQSGCIINVGSTAGIRPRPGLTWYNASKGAANLMSKSLAVELAPDNIRVNVICPVMGETGMLGDFMGIADTPENRAKFIATIPLGRLSQPSDIANVALFLAQDSSNFLTGLEFPVDGGRTV
ncbi:MAG TPA: glucose 1-dehydrogenase [Orrella sp.]